MTEVAQTLPETITEVSSDQEQRLRMTYDEYQAWDSGAKRTEWVAGEMIVFMPPLVRHQLLVGFFANLLTLFVRAFRLGVVITAPVEMRARPDGPAREPDILFIATEHQDRLTVQRLAGPADLVVEVVSRESAARDRSEKFYEYEEAGIPEYWLFDPRPGKERVDGYRLTEEGKYLAILPDQAGRYHSAILPGFWFHPDWLWQDPVPDPLLLLVEMAPTALEPVLAALVARQEST